MRKYTIQLYKELADDPEYPINYHHRTGGICLITDQNNTDASHHIISVAQWVGIDFGLLDPAKAARRYPLVRGPRDTFYMRQERMGCPKEPQ